MAILKREQALADLPQVQRATVSVPELGGEVIIRGLLLRDRLNLSLSGRTLANVARLLEASVIDEEGASLLTADEWERFGSKYADRALELWEKARELSGGRKDDDDIKNA